MPQLEAHSDQHQNCAHVTVCQATPNSEHGPHALAWFLAITTAFGTIAALITAIKS